MLWNMVTYYLFVLCKPYNCKDIKIFNKNFDVEKKRNRLKYPIKIHALKKKNPFLNAMLKKSKWHVVWYILFYHSHFLLKCVTCMSLIHKTVNVSDYTSFEYVRDIDQNSHSFMGGSLPSGRLFSEIGHSLLSICNYELV